MWEWLYTSELGILRDVTQVEGFTNSKSHYHKNMNIIKNKGIPNQYTI